MRNETNAMTNDLMNFSTYISMSLLLTLLSAR